MTDFGALIETLGERSVKSLGEEHVEQLTVVGDPETMTADVEICLFEDTWDEHTRAIDKMIDIRGEFLNTLSIAYRFTPLDSCMSESHAQRPMFAYA